MRLPILLISLTLVIISCKEKKAPAIDPTVQLTRLNSLYDSALVSKDSAFLRTLFSDDFIYTNAEGKLLNKDQMITNITVSEINMQSGASSDVRIKVYNGTAIVTGSFNGMGTFRGNPIAINERYTTAWVPKDTTWQLVAEQSTIIK